MIDHIVFDIDGTLTDGGIIISDCGRELKRFHVRDGQIIAFLPSIGFTTIFLTGRTSEVTRIRANELGVKVVMQGVSDKAATLQKYMNTNKIDKKRIAYVGDDLNDYAAMSLCAFKACPSDAAIEIRQICNYVSVNKGGDGAARDICEYILKCQNQLASFINQYMR